MNLAETMVARGYGSSSDKVLAPGTQIGLFAGLILAFGGWLLTFWQTALGWLLLVMGVLIMLLVYWRLGRRAPRTVYQKRPWQGLDWLVAAGAVLCAAIFLLPLPFVDYGTLQYSPYPALTLPGFDPVLGLAAAALALPAIVLQAYPQQLAYD